jgi:hypothetical protein
MYLGLPVVASAGLGLVRRNMAVNTNARIKSALDFSLLDQTMKSIFRSDFHEGILRL